MDSEFFDIMLKISGATSPTDSTPGSATRAHRRRVAKPSRVPARESCGHRAHRRWQPRVGRQHPVVAMAVGRWWTNQGSTYITSVYCEPAAMTG
jgi:hypothetical protein